MQVLRGASTLKAFFFSFFFPLLLGQPISGEKENQGKQGFDLSQPYTLELSLDSFCFS